MSVPSPQKTEARATPAQLRSLATVGLGKVFVLRAPGYAAYDVALALARSIPLSPQSLAACQNRGWIAEDGERAEPMMGLPEARRIPVVLTATGLAALARGGSS